MAVLGITVQVSVSGVPAVAVVGTLVILVTGTKGHSIPCHLRNGSSTPSQIFHIPDGSVILQALFCQLLAVA